MALREPCVRVALITVLMSACAAEDSVPPNVPGGGAGGSGAGGSISGGAGGSTSGSGGMGGMGGSSGMMAGVGGGGGESGGMGGDGGAMAGVGGGMGGDGGSAGTGGPGTAQDPDCDMNGIWIARMLSVAEALTLEQCGSIYYYLEFKQEGTNVEIVNHFNCGIEGRGSSNGTLNDQTLGALARANSQIGRKGTMAKATDGTCELSMEPFWVVIGADEAMYAPNPRNAAMDLAALQSSTPLPTTGDSALDLEGDGQPGFAIAITGAINGTRHGVQRNRQSWTTNERYSITPALDWTSDLEVRTEYIAEENVLAAVPDDPLLYAPSNTVTNSPSARVTLRFLGRDASDPRVADIIVSSDPADTANAVQTCHNIQTALPPIEALVDGLSQLCPCPGDVVCQ